MFFGAVWSEIVPILAMLVSNTIVIIIFNILIVLSTINDQKRFTKKEYFK